MTTLIAYISCKRNTPSNMETVLKTQTIKFGVP